MPTPPAPHLGDPLLGALTKEAEKLDELEQLASLARLRVIDIAQVAGEAVPRRPRVGYPPVSKDRYATSHLEGAISDAIYLVREFMERIPNPTLVLEILKRGGAHLPWADPEDAVLALGDRLRRLGIEQVLPR